MTNTPVPEDELLDKIGDICHERYLGTSKREDRYDEWQYSYETEVIFLLQDPRIKQAIAEYTEGKIREARNNMNFHYPRAMGKTAYFTEIFIKECKDGKSAEYHHPDYVVMSRKQYDKIQRKLQQPKDREE